MSVLSRLIDEFLHMEVSFQVIEVLEGPRADEKSGRLLGLRSLDLEWKASSASADERSGTTRWDGLRLSKSFEP